MSRAIASVSVVLAAALLLLLGGERGAQAGCSFGNALSVCTDRMIMKTLPGAGEFKKYYGWDLPDAVKSDSTYYKSDDDSYHYRRHWQGGPGGHPDITIDIGMYCDDEHAEQQFKKMTRYYRRVTTHVFRSKSPVRPYYVAHPGGRFLITMAIFFPDSRFVPDMSGVLEEMGERLGRLPCFSSFKPNIPRCPKTYTLTWSPKNPKVGQTVTVQAVGFKSTFWEKPSYKNCYVWKGGTNSPVACRLLGETFTFLPPGPGVYTVEMQVDVKKCGSYAVSELVRVSAPGGQGGAGGSSGGTGGGQGNGGSGRGNTGKGGGGNRPPQPPPSQRLTVSIAMTTAARSITPGRPVCFRAQVVGAVGGPLSMAWSLDGRRLDCSGAVCCWRSATPGRHSVSVVAAAGPSVARDALSFSVGGRRRPRPLISRARLVEPPELESPWGQGFRSRWRPGQQVCLQARLYPLGRLHRFQVIWRDPQGAPVASDYFERGPGRNLELVSCIFIATSAPLGRWQVEVEADGRHDSSFPMTIVGGLPRDAGRPAAGGKPPMRPWPWPRPKPLNPPSSGSSGGGAAGGGGGGGWETVPLN